jgi:hypothetical protein
MNDLSYYKLTNVPKVIYGITQTRNWVTETGVVVLSIM